MVGNAFYNMANSSCLVEIVEEARLEANHVIFISTSATKAAVEAEILHLVDQEEGQLVVECTGWHDSPQLTGDTRADGVEPHLTHLCCIHVGRRAVCQVAVAQIQTPAAEEASDGVECACATG